MSKKKFARIEDCMNASIQDFLDNVKKSQGILFTVTSDGIGNVKTQINDKNYVIETRRKTSLNITSHKLRLNTRGSGQSKKKKKKKENWISQNSSRKQRHVDQL